MRCISSIWTVLAMGALASIAMTAGAHQASLPKADFVAPAAGTYKLERISRVPDGAVLDPDGHRVRLAKFTHGRATLLSLMYTQCNDETGCPLALHALDLVRKSLAATPEMRGRVRLVSMSFDPARDTPEIMRDYAGERTKDRRGVPWAFLVPASRGDLEALLDGFGQDVSKTANESQSPAGELGHVLRVFLVDRRGWVREIYSTSYLVPQVLVNDVKTLLMEDGVRFP
jgi:protein SCO1/2